MIARHDECDQERLAMMLADSLDIDEQDMVTSHLDHCQSCRETLEHLAAEESWWQDTQAVLSKYQELETSVSLVAEPATQVTSASEHSTRGASSQPQAEIRATEHWVIGLLDPHEDPDMLGLVEGMPIESVIGQGGMGVVLKARDTSLHRYLAIKLLSPMLANSGAARQRFLREAQAAAAVVHPNIVPIYAISAERRVPFLVMPFVAGGNVQNHLDRHGPLSLERTLSIGLQVAEGLMAAHGQGIVHRDIKPANLMMDEGGFRIMLTDFGLARALDDATLTGSGMVAGTPQYMSPEQARGMAVDHRTDIYSLGAVLYALATGRPPVRGTSTLELLRRIGEEKPREVVEINETYPSWFQDLVDRLMATDLEQRVSSAEEVAQLLRSCLAHARAPNQAMLPERLRRSRRPLPWLAAIGASIVLLAGSLGLLWWKSQQEATSRLGSGLQSAPVESQGGDTASESVASQRVTKTPEFVERTGHNQRVASGQVGPPNAVEVSPGSIVPGEILPTPELSSSSETSLDGSSPGWQARPQDRALAENQQAGIGQAADVPRYADGRNNDGSNNDGSNFGDGNSERVSNADASSPDILDWGYGHLDEQLTEQEIELMLLEGELLGPRMQTQ